MTHLPSNPSQAHSSASTSPASTTRDQDASASTTPTSTSLAQDASVQEASANDAPSLDEPAKIPVVMYQPGADDPPKLSPQEAKKKYRRSVFFLLLIILGITVSVGMGIRRNRAYRDRHSQILLGNVQNFFTALASYAQGKSEQTYPAYYVNGADPAAEGFLGKVKDTLNPTADPAIGRGEAGSEGVLIQELQWADKNDLADEVTLVIHFDSTWAALFPHGEKGLVFRYIGGRWSYCPSASSKPHQP